MFPSPFLVILFVALALMTYISELSLGLVRLLPVCHMTLILVVLENSNVAQLASNLYLVVHTLPQEAPHDTDDASAGEIYAVFVPEASVCGIQSLRRRQQRPSGVDRNAHTHRTAALYGLRPSIL
jgi:hypothetical protein